MGSALGSLNVAALTQPQQRGFLVAAIAGLVVVLGFFILPFAGALGFNVTAAALANFAGWLWLVPLCALAAGGLAAWRAASTQPNTPTGLNRRNTSIAAAILGGIAALLLLIVLFTAQSYSSQTDGLAGLAWGYWIMLIAAGGVVAGGLMQRNIVP